MCEPIVEASCGVIWAGFRGSRGPVPRPPANGGPPTEPFHFFLSLMIDAYETTT